MNIKYGRLLIIFWIVFVCCILVGTHFFTQNKVETLLEQKATVASESMKNEARLMVQNKKHSMVAISLALSENADIIQALLNNNPNLLFAYRMAFYIV